LNQAIAATSIGVRRRRPPGKGWCWICLAADGFANDPASQASCRNTVSGEALREVDIAAQPPPVRCAVATDINVSTPDMLESGACQLREHPGHAPQHRTGQVGRRQRGIAGATAEQQTVIAAQAEIVQRPVHVRYRHIVSD